MDEASEPPGQGLRSCPPGTVTLRGPGPALAGPPLSLLKAPDLLPPLLPATHARSSTHPVAASWGSRDPLLGRGRWGARGLNPNKAVGWRAVARGRRGAGDGGGGWGSSGAGWPPRVRVFEVALSLQPIGGQDVRGWRRGRGRGRCWGTVVRLRGRRLAPTSAAAPPAEAQVLPEPLGHSATAAPSRAGSRSPGAPARPPRAAPRAPLRPLPRAGARRRSSAQ